MKQEVAEANLLRVREGVLGHRNNTMVSPVLHVYKIYALTECHLCAAEVKSFVFEQFGLGFYNFCGWLLVFFCSW